MYRDVLGFSISPHMSRIMAVEGCYASIMRSEKKTEEAGDGLPLGVPIPVLPVDYLKDRPEHWIGGEGSYVCPVDSEWGLWFNFTMNDFKNMAVLTSVKGMNPLTGQRLTSYSLEDFKEECPIHKVRFSVDKLCPECGFKWPSQNYLSDPNPFYIDGFRTPDGNVRQFYFTEDASKSIPEQVIGKDDTVPAFGFCFYHLKNRYRQNIGGLSIRDEFPKIKIRSGSYGSRDFLEKRYRGGLGTLRSASLAAPSASSSYYSDSSRGHIELNSESTGLDFSEGVMSERSVSFSNTSCSVSEDYTKGGIICSMGATRDRSGIEVGLGAGEKIKQAFIKSNQNVEAYKEKPTGVIRLYFVFQEEFEKYVSRGLKDLRGSSEGYLTGLPMGAKS